MDKHYDTQAINHNADLLALAGVSLKRVASTGGGEWAGSCPFCGGNDRFRVQPKQGRWLCHHCTNSKWKDAIELGRRLWPGETFRAVLERLSGGTVPTVNQKEYIQEPTPAAAPPSLEWQRNAAALVSNCEQALWQPVGARALAYLHRRGLNDATIRRFHLGYREEPKGIVIPCFVNGALWYVKFRQPIGEPKYILLKGSKPATIFNGDDLVNDYPALFVEGEFDCMIAWQEMNELLPIATLGSATNSPDLATWGRYFLTPNKTLILPDNDEAGNKGANTVARYSRYPVLTSLPAGPWKDPTDYYQAGGNLKTWMLELLNYYDPI